MNVVIFGILLFACIVILIFLVILRRYLHKTGQDTLEAVVDAEIKLYYIVIAYQLYTDYWSSFCASIITHLGH